jgi:hypothetical protein
MKTKEEILSQALDLLYTLEDRTQYENQELGEAIDILQTLLKTINN